jgi:SAM-dependent methyltransferase
MSIDYFPYKPSEVLELYGETGKPLYVQTLRETMGDLRGQRVLDAGGGLGFLGEIAFSAGAAEVVLLDISEPMIRCAQHRARQTRYPFTFVCGDAGQLKLVDDSFDLVMCHLLLHTTRDPIGILTELKRVARPGGRILAIEPIESASIFASSDSEFVTGAEEFISKYLEYTSLCGFDFDLGIRLPDYLTKTGWQVEDTVNFLHANCGKIDQNSLKIWHDKLQLAKQYAEKPLGDTDLSLFKTTRSGNALTALSVMIVSGLN